MLERAEEFASYLNDFFVCESVSKKCSKKYVLPASPVEMRHQVVFTINVLVKKNCSHVTSLPICASDVHRVLPWNAGIKRSN